MSDEEREFLDLAFRLDERVFDSSDPVAEDLAFDLVGHCVGTPAHCVREPLSSSATRQGDRTEGVRQEPRRSGPAPQVGWLETYQMWWSVRTLDPAVHSTQWTVPCVMCHGVHSMHTAVNMRRRVTIGGMAGRIAGNVSDESFEGWRAYCARHGITVSAFIEAIGRILAERQPDGPLTPLQRQVIDEARRVMVERTRRDI